MEKILRKVSCKIRLPMLNGFYYTSNGEQHWAGEWVMIQQDVVEYWYEEVDLTEQLRETFEAGRNSEPRGMCMPNKWKYETFGDYLKSLENDNRN